MFIMQPLVALSSDTSPSTDDIARVARELYGVDVGVERLPGYEDLNFLLTGAGSRSVLKIASGPTLRADLELQDVVMEWLHSDLPGLFARALPTTSGGRIGEVQGPAGARLVRMLCYLPGQRMADVPAHSPELLGDLGGFLARMDRRLLSLEHADAARVMEWSLSETSALRGSLGAVTLPRRLSLVEPVLDRYDSAVAPVLSKLRRCIIHNDANDYNLLVDPTASRVAGLIDFGDVVLAPLICELAIALAYAIFDKEEPLEVACLITAAYHRELPLSAEEVDVLFDLVRSRLAMSVILCSRELRARPENRYLEVSVAPALRALTQLERVDPLEAQARLRQACGIDG